MGDFLAELLDQFDPEEQAGIRAAEAVADGILAQGDAAVRDRLLAAGSHDARDWVLQPESYARADAGGVVFVAYVNALWRETDAARAECIDAFLAKVDRLVDPLLTRYGREGEGLIAALRWRCQMNTSIVHSHLQTSTTSAMSSTTNSAAGSPQNGTDHASGHPEASDTAEQPEMESGQPGAAEGPVISVQPPAILDFSDSWHRRERRKAGQNAGYARRRGRVGSEADRQEELLKDARVWAEAELRKLVSEVQDVFELKERVVHQAWNEFVPQHRYYPERPSNRLLYREFAAALWEEGWPSLEDRAILAIRDRAASAGSQAGAVVTGSPAEGRGEDRAPPGPLYREAPPRGGAEELSDEWRRVQAEDEWRQRQIKEEDDAAAAAFEILSKQPAWNAVQTRICSLNVAELEKPAPAGFDIIQERAEAFKAFDKVVVLYLRTVSSIETANAFCRTLPVLSRAAFSNCRMGRPPQYSQPVSAEAQSFERTVALHIERAKVKAYKKGSRAATMANVRDTEKQSKSPQAMISERPEVVTGSSAGEKIAARDGSEARSKAASDIGNPERAERAKTRSDWLDQKLAQHSAWTSDADIAGHGGPAYNTIQRYRRGALSTRDLYVRRQLAKALKCETTEVPA
jgi:hypothetical protein